MMILLCSSFQHKEAEEPEGQTNDAAEPQIDINSLKTLTDIGIDMSFLDEYGKPANKLC